VWIRARLSYILLFSIGRRTSKEKKSICHSSA
jgi:hypothetical protein